MGRGKADYIEPIRGLLGLFRIALAGWRIDPRLVGKLVRALNGLPPEAIGSAMYGIRDEAQLWSSNGTVVFGSVLGRSRYLKILARQPGVALPFLFHGDGYVREAALNTIKAGPVSAFVLAAIMYRLNDWAEPVRQAAARCVRRVLPETSARTIADTTACLLVQSAEWGRWGANEAVFDEVLRRDDAVSELVARILADKTGRLTRPLRRLMRSDLIDPFLADIAANAHTASARTVATRALADGRARWVTGWEKRWIDKTYYIFRREAVMAERPLSVMVELPSVIERAMRDHSAQVRKVAADAAIAGTLDEAIVRAIIEQLKDDPNPGIRDRIDFLIRRSQSESQPESDAS